MTAFEGEFLMRFRDGKIGNVKLKSVELSVELNEVCCVEFEGEVVLVVGFGFVCIVGVVLFLEVND